MGGHACGPMGLAAPRALGAPQRWSSPRAGRRMGQVGLGPIPLPPPWRLLMPLVSPFLCGLRTCPCWPHLMHLPPQMVPVVLCSVSLGVPFFWHLPPACVVAHPVLPIHSSA